MNHDFRAAKNLKTGAAPGRFFSPEQIRRWWIYALFFIAGARDSTDCCWGGKAHGRWAVRREGPGGSILR